MHWPAAARMMDSDRDAETMPRDAMKIASDIVRLQMATSRWRKSHNPTDLPPRNRNPNLDRFLYRPERRQNEAVAWPCATLARKQFGR